MTSIIDQYTTIAAPTKSEININRSRFIAYAYPITNAQEALDLVDLLRKEHHSATHVCWAYALDPQWEEVRSSDDGEPSGTAGRPILGRLTALEITATLVAVVRYFGGVKLGTSGLIDAYRDSAQMALELAEQKIVIQEGWLRASFKPDLMGAVMRIIKQFEAHITAQDYTTCYHLTIGLRLAQITALQEALQAIYGVEVKRVEKSE